MEAKVREGHARGVMGGLKRAVLVGESLFLARYTARGAGASGSGLFGNIFGG